MNTKLSRRTIIQLIGQIVNYIYQTTSSLFTTNRIDGREQMTDELASEFCLLTSDFCLQRNNIEKICGFSVAKKCSLR